MRSDTISILSVLSLAAGLVAQEPVGFVGPDSDPWPTGITRTWPGPDLHGNRLQDWRVHDGRLECRRSAANRPLRVVHHLTVRATDVRAGYRVTVWTTPVDDGATDTATFAGFVLGAGGEDVEYRRTALSHHRPAADGGMVVAIDGAGRITFRDNETNVVGGSWGIAGPLRDGELQPYEPGSQAGPGFGDGGPVEVELEVEVLPAGADTYRVVATARRVAGRELVASATLDDVAPKLVEGSLALVSHRGPEGSDNGWAFRRWRMAGGKLAHDPARRFGPVWATLFTREGGTVRMTAQMPPLGAQDTRTAVLELAGQDPATGQWGAFEAASTATLVADANTFPFVVDGLDPAVSYAFRVRYALKVAADATTVHTYEGVIPAAPAATDPVVLAAFTGTKHFTGGIRWNETGLWFPHEDLVAAVATHDPDLLFFSGDQVYEGDITGAQRRPLEEAILDYQDKWLRWCWAFGDLTRRVPCIAIPDDHDVYHGNIWGAGGRAAARQDDGGYTMPARFVKMVETTQTSHLPPPFDPRPVEQGIGTYFTDLQVGGVSFAILEDRKFKASPTVALPEANIVNGWPRNADFDPRANGDVPEAPLLGDRQLRFLESWAQDWDTGTWAKVALSQTIFANVATLPKSANNDGVVPGLRYPEPGEYPDDALASDGDSNGWPPSGRNRALRILRKAHALHVAGDQHLASCIEYGVDAFGDAGFAFCVPSVANTFPRRWFPPEAGFGGRAPGAPAYTGNFLDGWGNRITVFAVANPAISGKEPSRLHDRMPGYGIVRMDREGRRFTIECWPRWARPGTPGAAQYPGWPITTNVRQQYGREAVARLPELRFVGMTDPVVQVHDAATGEHVYSLRVEGDRFRPPVFAAGRYRVSCGEPGTAAWRVLELATDAEGPVDVRLDG